MTLAERTFLDAETHSADAPSKVGATHPRLRYTFYGVNMNRAILVAALLTTAATYAQSGGYQNSYAASSGYLYPRIGEVTVACSDEMGRPIPLVLDPRLSDVGQALPGL